GERGQGGAIGALTALGRRTGTDRDRRPARRGAALGAAVGELAGAELTAFGSAISLDQPARNGRREERVAVRHGLERREQPLRRGVLEHEAARAGTQRLVDVFVEVEG